MSNINYQRWAAALRRVAKIERQSSILPRRFLPRKFSYAKRSAWSTPAGLAVLPRDQQPDLPGVGVIRERVRAESVLIGKFDVDAEVRLRSFYPGPRLSVRYQTGGERNGIIRTVRAHNLVHPHAPDLMPEVFEHGSILNGEGAYLVETTVAGQPATRTQLRDLIAPLTAKLHRVHQGVGITSKPLIDVVGTGYAWRWSKACQSIDVEPQIDQRVRNLIDRNDQLETSLSHGDLVGSNILVSDQKFVLVDWEFAEHKPIAFDMAKIIINVDDVETTLAIMHTGLGGIIGQESDHYTLHEQIALAIVLTLSWHPNHAAKAQVAGRTDALKRQTTKRLQAIKQLLEIP